MKNRAEAKTTARKRPANALAVWIFLAFGVVGVALLWKHIIWAHIIPRALGAN